MLNNCQNSHHTIGDYTIQKSIGQGTFGKVFKGRFRTTGQMVAVKRVLQDKKYKNR